MMWAPKPHQTPFETLIQTSATTGLGLDSEINTHFDPHSGLLYERRDYAFARPLSLIDGLPDEDWVVGTLSKLVRDEFSGGHNITPPPPEPVFAEPVYVDAFEAAYEYLDACESQLIFGGPALEIARTETDVTRALYEVMTHPALGNAVNRRNVPFESFSKLVTPSVEAQDRLIFVFPGFPFKDQNPFRTLNAPEEHDLAEIALLIRLHSLSTAIFQVYPMGAEWIILSDGLAFSRALRVSEVAILEYQRRLIAARNRLDLGRAVSIVDYAGLAKIIDAPPGHWNAVLNEVEGILRSSHVTPIQDSLKALRVGMKRNVNLADVRASMSWSDWWAILQASDASSLTTSQMREKFREVDEICAESAIVYAAFNLAAKFVRLEGQAFPGALRATIHPKRGQIAVPRIGAEFPWNGTAVLDGTRINSTALSCKSLRELSSRGRKITPFVDESGRTLFVTLGDEVTRQ